MQLSTEVEDGNFLAYCYFLQKMFGCFVRLSLPSIDHESGPTGDVLRPTAGEGGISHVLT